MSSGAAEDVAESGRLIPLILADVEPEPPVSTIVEGTVLADDLTGVFGEGDAGKSTMVYALAVHVATGTPLFGRFAIRAPGKVLVVTSGEDRAPLIKNRCTAFCAGLGLSALDTDIALSMIHVLDQGVNLDSLSDLLALQKLTTDCGYSLITLDPIADLIGDRANALEDRDARRIYRNLRGYLLAPHPGLGIVIAGHATKSAENRTKKQRVFGSAAWVNGLRQCWFLERRDGGFTMDSSPKGNRRADRPCYRVARTVTTERDGTTWTLASLALEEPGRERVSDDVLAVLRLVGRSKMPPNSRELESLVKHDAEMGADRAGAAIGQAKSRGWIESSAPGRARAWTLSDTGRARLALSAGSGEAEHDA